MATEETLAWEARRRVPAALAAVIGVLLGIAGYVILAIVLGDAPRSAQLDALGRAVAPGPVGATPSGRIPLLEYYSDHIASLAAAGAARGLSLLLTGLALYFLALATRARNDELSKAALYAPLVGGVLSLLSSILSPIGTYRAANAVIDGPGTVDAVSDGATSAVAAAAQLIDLVANVAIAAGFVLVCLYAMRVGLLTRFMGILGMLAGAITLLPITPGPVVQAYWLLALALLFSGRWPGGVPPAWLTGRAEPWPSQQELREQRMAAAGEPRPEPEPAAVAADGAATPAGRPHPSSRKKKRKRRA